MSKEPRTRASQGLVNDVQQASGAPAIQPLRQFETAAGGSIDQHHMRRQAAAGRHQARHLADLSQHDIVEQGTGYTELARTKAAEAIESRHLEIGSQAQLTAYVVEFR